MKNGWRTLAIVLALVCTWQTWRGCARSHEVPRATPAVTRDATEASRAASVLARRAQGVSSPASPSLADGPRLFGMKLPGWTRALLPQKGEDLRVYRDRMIPLARMAIQPQRDRVARAVLDMATATHLEPAQRKELDAAVAETASAIEDRVFEAVLSGELQPGSFKPMIGVTIARDVLDLVDKGNQRFTRALRDDQRTILAKHPFDFGDYLVFSTRWEDAISGL